MLKLIDYLLIIILILLSILVGFLPKIIDRIAQRQKRGRASAGKSQNNVDNELEVLNQATLDSSDQQQSANGLKYNDPVGKSGNILSQSVNSLLRITNLINNDESKTGGNKKQASPNFLMNSISIVISFQTAISTLGMPVEFYFYGFKTFQYTLSFVFAALIVAVFFVPLVYRIKSRSIYEYLDDKFEGAKSVKNFALILAIANQLSISSSVLFSTAICVMQIISLSYPIRLWPVATAIGLISAFMAILGLESIVWANFIQYVILIVCNVLIVVFGIKNYNASGSFGSNLNEMLNVTRVAERGQIFILNENMRYRYTIWNCLFGLLVGWISSYGFSQQNFMRIKSAKTATRARLLMFSIIPFGFFNLSLILLLGFVAFVYFYRCGDPLASGTITNQNQLFIKFLTQFYSEYNGLLGMFVGVLISSSIGTLSSVLKALSVTLGEDIFKKILLKRKKTLKSATTKQRRQKASQKQIEELYGEDLLEMNAKSLPKNHQKLLKKYKKKIGLTRRKMDMMLIAGSAAVITIIAILLELLPGSVISISFSIINSFSGPMLLIYLCAKFNDYSNKRFKYAENVGRRGGSKLRNFRIKAADLVTSSVLAILAVQLLYVGQLTTYKQFSWFYQYEKLPLSKPLDPNTASSELSAFCHLNESENMFRRFSKNHTSFLFSTKPNNLAAITAVPNPVQREEASFWNHLYAISFNWYTFLGFTISTSLLLLINLIRLVFSLLNVCFKRLFCRNFNTILS